MALSYEGSECPLIQIDGSGLWGGGMADLLARHSAELPIEMY